MENDSEKNPQPQTPAPADSVDALAARIKAAEANPAAGKAHVIGDGNLTSDAQVQDPTHPPAATPPPAGIKEGLQQSRDKGGAVDLDKIQKGNEHLERGIKEKEEILRRNRELLQKFTRTSQEAAETKRKLESNYVPPPPPQNGNGQDHDKVFLERLARAEHDPLVFREIIREEMRAGLAQESGEFRSFMDGVRQESIYSQRASELDELIRAGHSSIATEGLGRFEKVFEEMPFLLQSRTPYIHAMRHMDDVPNGPASAPAQGAPPVPILGAGGAAPPPTSAPTVTRERKMEDLSRQFHEALKFGDREGAGKLMAEMTRLEQGR